MLKIGSKIQEKLKLLQSFYQNTSFQPYTVKRDSDGVVFDFYIGDITGKKWYDADNLSFLKSPDPNSKEVLEMGFVKQEIVRRGDVVFECGGHHGMTAIKLCNWVGSEGKVVSFDPNPTNISIIQKNLSMNNLENAIVEHKAVGAANSKMSVFKLSNTSIVPTGDGGARLLLKKIFYGVEEVEIIALDSYAEQHNLKPTFLKIDVEGYEVEVLKGAKKILESVPKLLVEVHTPELSEYGTSVQEMMDLIDISRYRAWIQLDSSKTPVPFEMVELEGVRDRFHLYAVPK